MCADIEDSGVTRLADHVARLAGSGAWTRCACFDAASIAASEIRPGYAAPITAPSIRFAGGQFAIRSRPAERGWLRAPNRLLQEISVRTGTRAYAGLELGSRVALDDGLREGTQVRCRAPMTLIGKSLGNPEAWRRS